MTKNLYSSFFYADDKDLYDLLSPARQKLPPSRLLEIARTRGIWLSPEETREDLVRYVSLLPHDWHQLNRVIDLTETSERTEKNSAATISYTADRNKILAAAEIIKARCAEEGEVCEIRATGPSSVTIKVRYPDFDPSKTRLRQRRDREVELEIETRGDEVNFRYTSNEKAKQIFEEIIDALPKEDASPPAIREVSLFGVKNPAARTQFFIDLFNSLKGWHLFDVSNVKVDRMPPDTSSPFTGNNALEEENDESTRFPGEEKAMAGIVRKISLRGEGLIYSDEYRRLCAAGFFISRSVWLVDEDKPDGRRVEFEAGFNQPEYAVDFRYTVRSVFERKKDGNFKQSRAVLLDIDRKDLLRQLESASQLAYSKATTSSSTSVYQPTQAIDFPMAADEENPQTQNSNSQPSVTEGTPMGSQSQNTAAPPKRSRSPKARPSEK